MKFREAMRRVLWGVLQLGFAVAIVLGLILSVVWIDVNIGAWAGYIFAGLILFFVMSAVVWWINN